MKHLIPEDHLESRAADKRLTAGNDKLSPGSSLTPTRSRQAARQKGDDDRRRR